MIVKTKRFVKKNNHYFHLRLSLRFYDANVCVVHDGKLLYDLYHACVEVET